MYGIILYKFQRRYGFFNVSNFTLVALFDSAPRLDFTSVAIVPDCKLILLGVKAVISESFERIHRANLVGMGVLPLNFVDGQSAALLGLDGTEIYDFDGLNDGATELTVNAKKANGKNVSFKARVRINAPVEWQYYQHGGVLQYMLRQMTAS